MPSGNPLKPPLSSFSGQSHNRKTRWESSAASASASAAPEAAHHKLIGTSKPKPSPHSTATPPNNKDPNKQPPASKPNSRPENPSPRPENPNARPGPSHAFPPLNEPPPPPAYGFHMLDRRSIVLADGSVRSYFALPPDYEKFTQMIRPSFRPGFIGHHEFGLERPPFPMSPDFLGPDGRPRNMGPESSLKRKFGEEERGGRDDGFERQRKQLLQYGNANGPGTGPGPGPSVGYNLGRGEELRAPKSMRYAEGSSSKVKHSEVDQNALKKSFLHFVKLVFESANQKKSYLANKKQGPLPCLACGRSSKDFQDAHSLIMHAYNSDKEDQLVEHLAFHKALCILMGWNYMMPPDNSKAYQNLSVNDAEAALDDLILWPPTVLIHNTVTGKGKDGRMEGLGNRAMDSSLRELGFATGKSVSMYAREGHLGIHVVKFSGDESGLMDALKMADYFARDKRGRKDWARVQPTSPGKDDEKNPKLVKLDPKTGDKTRVFYGHLATAADLEKITFEVKKKVSIVSLREYKQSR